MSLRRRSDRSSADGVAASQAPSDPRDSWYVCLNLSFCDRWVGSAEAEPSWVRVVRLINAQLERDLISTGENSNPRVLLGHEDGLDGLLGWTDPDGTWRPGMAGLSPREALFMGWALRGQTARWIARAAGHHKGQLSVPLSLTSVYDSLADARRKLLTCLAPFYPEFAGPSEIPDEEVHWGALESAI